VRCAPIKRAPAGSDATVRELASKPARILTEIASIKTVEGATIDPCVQLLIRRQCFAEVELAVELLPRLQQGLSIGPESDVSLLQVPSVIATSDMSELEVLLANIDALKALLRIAWKDLANPLLTAFERREARNQINQYSIELRRHLQRLDDGRLRSRNESCGKERCQESVSTNFGFRR
jgi:capsid protein